MNLLCMRQKLPFTRCRNTVHVFKNIKNGFHDTIHTFKNYFTTVFLILTKISLIQTAYMIVLRIVF